MPLEGTVQDVLPGDTKVVTVAEDAAVEDGLKTLLTHGILSAPIVDGRGKVTGLLDMFDLLSWVVQVFGDYSGATSKDQILARMKQGLTFSLESVKFIKNLSGRDVFVPVKKTTPLADVVAQFAKGVHRVVLVDDDTKPVWVLSQSHLLAYLSEHPDLVGAAGDTVLDSIMTREVVSVSMDDHVIDVLVKMVAYGISAVPVLDKSGALLLTFSVSDIKRLADIPASAFNSSLSVPVREFLTRADETTDAKSPAIAVKAEDTVKACVLKIKAVRVHRMWVEKDGRLSGVVSLTDIFKLML